MQFLGNGCTDLGPTYLLRAMAGIELTHSLLWVRTITVKAPLLCTMATPVLSSRSPPLENRYVLSFSTEHRTRNDIVRPASEWIGQSLPNS